MTITEIGVALFIGFLGMTIFGIVYYVARTAWSEIKAAVRWYRREIPQYESYGKALVVIGKEWDEFKKAIGEAFISEMRKIFKKGRIEK
jgi:hypothetical protein